MDMKAEIIKGLAKEGITMESFPSLFETIVRVIDGITATDLRVPEGSETAHTSKGDR